MSEHRTTAHPEAELASSWVLGALDAKEAAEFEAHLASCAECRDAVRDVRETLALLAHAAPRVAPPAALRERVLREAGTAQSTAQSSARPLVGASARAPRAWLPSRAGWFAAAASLVLAAALGAKLREERGARAAVEGALARSERVAAERDSLLSAVLAADVVTGRLVSTGVIAPALRVYWQKTSGVVVLAGAAFDHPAPGRTYQLWGIHAGGPPQSLGTFVPDSSGAVRAVLRVPVEAAMETVAVTEEAAPGSAKPTSAPFLAGALGAK